MVAAGLPSQGHAQSLNNRFEASLFVGHGTSVSYGSGFGLRVGARAKREAGSRSLILGARGAWHSGGLYEAFEELYGFTFFKKTDRKVSYGALELGPGWFLGRGEKLRIRAFGLIGVAFVNAKTTFSGPASLPSQSSLEKKLLVGPFFDITIPIWQVTIGGEFGLILTPDVGSVVVYGHMGGLWD